ncbi:hypothetical protein D3C87_1435520 [compost metagenome]
MAGGLGQRELFGQLQRLAVPAVEVDTVEPVAGGDKPLLVRREADLVRVVDIGHALLDLARDRVQEHQVVADRVGNDQRLVVRRGDQVVRFLADGKGFQHLLRVLVDQGDGCITRIKDRHNLRARGGGHHCQCQRADRHHASHNTTQREHKTVNHEESGILTFEPGVPLTVCANLSFAGHSDTNRGFRHKPRFSAAWTPTPSASA